MTPTPALALFAPLVLAAAELFRPLGFDAALTAAGQERKIVLVAFEPRADAESQKLDQKTWSDAKVRKWIEEKSVALKVDPQAAPELIERFHLHAYPTVVFVKADGTEIDRVVGLLDPKSFREEADAILSGADALERLRKLVAKHENEPPFRLDLARMLFARGQFEEAGREYLWCFDRGVQADPAFADVRNGPVLEELVKVGRVHPQTFDELTRRADAIAAKIADCTALRSELADFGRIAKATEHPDRVLEVYDSVAGTECTAIVRGELLPQAIGPLVDAQRYDEVVEWIGDAKARLQRRIAEFDTARTTEHDKTTLDRIAQRRTSIRVEALLHHQALVGAKKSKEAAVLADELLLFDRGALTYLGLVRSAESAEDKPLAATIAERALADAQLAQSDKKLVREKTAALLKKFGKGTNTEAAPAAANGTAANGAKKPPPVDDAPN